VNQRQHPTEPKAPGPGRPSLSVLRRQQIIDGFIAQIADRGLDSVTMDDVANVAGVQRAALRHFVGNRRELLAAALEELVQRFQRDLLVAAGAAPSFDQLVDHLLSGSWTERMDVEHRAFDVLVQEASRDVEMNAQLRSAYDLLINEIAAALQRTHPGANAARVHDTAYAIACIVEHHSVIHELGYADRYTRAATTAVKALASQLSPGAVVGPQTPVKATPRRPARDMGR
jgi:AcrR family transcriptional regulator